MIQVVSITELKQEQILEAALKRFSHFGVAKTTMAEIADDLLISKASLYYYFPDKTALVLSVGAHILTDFIKKQKQVLESSDDFEQGLKDLCAVRIGFGHKYFMMHIGDGQSDINTSDPKFKMLLDDLKQKEIEFLSEYIKRFVENGLVKKIEIQETAQLFIDVLVGIWIAEIHVRNKSLFPSEALFDGIKDKSERIISIFCDGLKRN